MILKYLDPVPFTIDNDSHLGLSETQGLLMCDGENLVIEFQIADTIIGALKGSMKRTVVPLGEVIRMEYRTRFFGLYNRLILRTRAQSSLTALPEAKQGQLRTIIRRVDRPLAETFAMEINGALGRIRGELMSEDIDRMELE